MTQTALASDLDLTKVAIGGLLDRMEASGFVERRADASDGRARRVYLTRAGGKLVTTIRESVEQIELQIPAKVSTEERRVGTKGVRTCSCRWSPDHSKTKQTK